MKKYENFKANLRVLKMLASRNNAAHIYDEHAAKELVQNILGTYTKAFQEMETYIDEHYQTALGKNLLS